MMGKQRPAPPNFAASSKPAHYRRRPKKQMNGFANSNVQTPAESSEDIPEPAASNTIPDGPDQNKSENEEIFANMPSFQTLAGKINMQVLNTILNGLKFERMTPIQAAAIEPLLESKDMLGQARTGTGKTMAFLIPAIETLLRTRSANVSALVISPTRELVLQIASEAGKLLSALPQVKVRTAIGGTNKDKESRQIHSGCHILVATPGRLLDHLSDEQMQYQLSSIDTLILDEADRMLDMGFLPDIKRIISYLPPRDKRQSMLFSATVPGSIVSVAKTILKPDYLTISTIPEGEGNTHKRVKQFFINVPTMNDLTTSLVSVVASELETAAEFKAIVFAPTAVLSDLYSHILEQKFGSSIPVLTMHSRMSQPKRISTTNDFRKAKNAICIATDVIARGMDFPLVTHVIQIGLPMNRESYIHRLGRTARADASGVGIFILSEAEKSFLRELKDVTFQDYGSQVAQPSLQDALDTLDVEKKGKIYQGWLGYYKAMKKYTMWSNEELVAEGNKFALEGLACPEVPELEASTVGKMGLKGTKGLKVGANKPRGGGRGGGGDGGGSGRGGRGGRGGYAGILKG